MVIDGMTVGTILTLLVEPVIYTVVERLSRKSKSAGKKNGSVKQVMLLSDKQGCLSHCATGIPAGRKHTTALFV